MMQQLVPGSNKIEWKQETMERIKHIPQPQDQSKEMSTWYRDVGTRGSYGSFSVLGAHKNT
jgi:hypothetical protein